MEATYLSQLCERLKESRKLLGLTQDAAAELVGVTREHWGRCERGHAMPGGEVWAALAEAGADVAYILTGKRTGEVKGAPAMSKRARALLDNYESADDEAQRTIESVASLATQSAKKKAA